MAIPSAGTASEALNGLEACVWTTAEVRLAWRIAKFEVCHRIVEDFTAVSGFGEHLGGGSRVLPLGQLTSRDLARCTKWQFRVRERPQRL